VELNCAAVPDNLLESELFGHARGSFTGATADRAGRFEAAHHGTLFLDEVAELPLPLQAKLLRAVQDRVIERVGETRSRPVDIRIVAATNRDLAAAVEAGQFRADLFYRLEVVPVRLPPLAERPDDIPLLADHLLRQFQQRHQMPPARLSPAAVVALQTATWPGNVRELTNVIQRSATFAAGEGAHTVEPRHMFPGRSDPDGGDPAGEVGFHEATRRFQRHLVQAALLATDWNVSETARRLRVARSYLYRLMDSHSMRRDEP
jgi:Nif-specific regulatory protein